MPSRGRVVGLALTILFLGLALYRVDFAELGNELRSVNYTWLLPSALCTLLGYTLRTARWRVILSGAARAPFRTLFAVLIMGFATNNLLPGRLGELWRGYLLGRKRGVRKTFALASVFVERVCDGLVLMAVLGVVSTTVALPGWGREIQLLAALIFLGATACVALLLWRPRIAHGLMMLVLRPAPARVRAWADEAFGAFVDGLAELRRPRTLLVASLLSVGVWAFEGASYLLLANGMQLGLKADQTLPAMGLTLVTINLGIMVPSAPGYVGTQEFFGTAALGFFGVAREPALALVLVSHAVQYVLVTGLGVVFFAHEQLSPRRLGALIGPRERRIADVERVA